MVRLTVKDFKGVTDDQLSLDLQRLRREEQMHLTYVKEKRSAIKQYEAEKERRKLAAYWKAHPDETPIYIGYKLLVKSDGGRLDWGLYKVAIIDLEQKDMLRMHIPSNVGMLIDWEDAQQARRNYLERENK
jgi:hypothetical protein